jgi:metal-responsive CopG/Arc/MetJ family transcriptional regulator
MGHTVGDTMAGMKVAISLPDPLFRAAERLARKLRKSRSQLYAEAIAEYVGALGAESVTARLNAVYGKESSEVEPALKYAQLERLSREAW